MSISHVGLMDKLKGGFVRLYVSSSEPLMRLANALDWQKIADFVFEDLKNTEKGYWWLGRKLQLRVHLGVMILQPLLKETDRGIEERVRQTPILQFFCGRGLVPRWRVPDHTKIEEFRSRLSPETYKKICYLVLKTARELGFADPRWMDLDSTVQEANITYPSDAGLMRKLADKCFQILESMKRAGKKYVPRSLSINIKEIQKKSLEYFFLPRNKAIEIRRELFGEYHKLVKHELYPFLDFLASLSPQAYAALPWNIKRAVDQVREKGKRYLLDVAHFIRTHSIKPGKILALHCSAVACIRKGKVGKENEFGRVYQLGRIGGNFLIPFTCTSLRMEDKESLIPAIEEHREIFGEDALQEIGTDKGYYQEKNVREPMKGHYKVNTDGVQRPVYVKSRPPEDRARELRARRAGTEPLIGHAKLFGLARSKMKSDETTLSSGYRCVMGFNLHQMSRHLTGQLKTP